MEKESSVTLTLALDENIYSLQSEGYFVHMQFATGFQETYVSKAKQKIRYFPLLEK